MRDITVVVELTVPDDMSDDSIKVFIETAIEQAIDRGITSYKVAKYLTDVVALKTHTIPLKDYPVLGFRVIADEGRRAMDDQLKAGR